MAQVTPGGAIGDGEFLEGPEERRRDREHRLADFSSLERSRLRSTPGLYRRAWRRFRQNKVAVASLVVLTVIVLFIAGADLVSALTGFSARENHLSAKLTPPFTDGYVLGSYGNGRDILTRLAYGGRVSLMIALLATLSTLVIGMTLGLIAGYAGGWTDALMMRLVDVMLSIPGLPLLILISALFSPGAVLLAFVIAAISWPSLTRLLRGEVLSLRKREYIEAARVVGAPPARILTKHLLPNVVPLAVIWAAISVPDLILVETGLSFLGLGVQVPTPSWGNMLNEAQRFYRTAWTNVLIPGMFIFGTSLVLYLVGIGLRDALDPRLSE